MSRCKQFSVLLLTAMLVPSIQSPSARAAIIPITEEFVLANQLHVDTSWDAIIATLFEQEGLVDYGSTMQVFATYNILEDPSGNFSGDYSALLSGTYLGEIWEISYSSNMFTEAATLNKIWNLDSTGEWKRGPHAGKKFTDKGKLTEKTNNKADLELEIETEGVTQKVKVTIKDLDKNKSGGKLKVSGEVEIEAEGKKHTEQLTLELDQKTKKFTSQLVSKSIFTVLTNQGTFTEVAMQNGFSGEMSYTLTAAQIPEPSAFLVWSFLGAVAFGVSVRRRRQTGRSTPSN